MNFTIFLMNNLILNVRMLSGVLILPIFGTQDGFVYLNCIMDLFSRKIIAWTLADTMEVSTVIETINKANAIRKTDLPLIIHSDRGSQYVSNACVQPLKKCSEVIHTRDTHTTMPV
ncbi:DDE-type integrase/transposase/recombinase [Lachnobacterium bovis]|uniref:DDE-type integrase/transposase/recombinase n=1 Tax=Lachnobacterium bovis TaxID=140626 RepID=UPI003B507589